jgi:HD-GYP domain-containing protein (c-di-GMP phosphodiesterase class II)
VATIVRATHERWDGHGYPDGLAGDQIPLGARIIAVCDAYDAMTTDRCYRQAIDHGQACEELRREAGHQFDRTVTDALLEELGQHAPATGASAGAGGQPGEDEAAAAEEVMSYLRDMLARHTAASAR